MAHTAVDRDFELRTVPLLRTLARRLRGLLVLRGMAYVMVAGGVASMALLVLDITWRLPVDMRAALLVLAVLGVGAVCWRRMVQPQLVRLGPPTVAHLIERRFPQLGSLLISAVRFQRNEVGPPQANSPELMNAVLGRATASVAALNLDSLLNRRQAYRSGGVALLIAAAMIVAFVAAPQTMGVWFERSILLGDTQWPRRTRIVVDQPGGVLHAARGDDVEIRAEIPNGYRVPRLVEIVFTTKSGSSGREQMIRVGDRGYRYTMAAAMEDFEFYLEGGDDRTDVYQAELTDRPAIESATLSVTPPAYAQQAAYDLPPDQRHAEVLPGSTITFRFTPNKLISRATLMAGEERVADAMLEGSVWSAGDKPQRSAGYHFRLVDELGLENKRPLRFAVRMLKDQAPRATLKADDTGNMVTTGAVLPLQLAFRDDYALAGAELVYQITREGETEHTLPLPGLSPGAQQHETTMELAVASLEVINGDEVTLFVRATDYDDINGPNVGVSSALRLRVVSGEELLAKLAEREQEYRRAFERAIDEQEDVRRILLTAIERLGEGGDHASGVKELGLAERRQRLIAGQVNGLRHQFGQILTQLRINGLATGLTEDRLGSGIVAPLTELAKRDLVLAADAVRRLAQTADNELDVQAAADVDPQQAAILARMRSTLARMLKWEGYQEAVTLLRDILRLQEELSKETADRIDRQAADVFEDE